MEEKRGSIIDRVPDLLVAPHMLDKLIRLILAEWQPDAAEQEQLVAHLIECVHCRTVLIILLFAQQEEEKLNPSPDAPAHALFTRFVALHHEILEHDYERMGAYAETIVAEGTEEADRRFPVLAEHISRCPDCKATLEETLAFLNEPEETG